MITITEEHATCINLRDSHRSPDIKIVRITHETPKTIIRYPQAFPCFQTIFYVQTFNGAFQSFFIVFTSFFQVYTFTFESIEKHGGLVDFLKECLGHKIEKAHLGTSINARSHFPYADAARILDGLRIGELEVNMSILDDGMYVFINIITHF